MFNKSDNETKSWKEFFYDGNVDLTALPLNKSWMKLFAKLFRDEEVNVDKIQRHLSKSIQRGVEIYPYPELLFTAFNLVSLDEIQVVIIGQDPYPSVENNVPQATGLAFSVPKNITIPSSLQNIFKNLVKFKHIKAAPAHGNLEHVAKQGVLFLNTALTVQAGHPGSHIHYWTAFTDKVIKYIVKKRPDTQFILWGSQAIEKANLSNDMKFIASSHPSGLSRSRPCGGYPAFEQCDFNNELDIEWIED